MSRSRDSDDADIGYKIMLGDYIVMTTPFNISKSFKVTNVTSKEVWVELSNRHKMRFLRYYALPFEPLNNNNNPMYRTTNVWSVRVNDTKVKKRFIAKEKHEEDI